MLVNPSGLKGHAMGIDMNIEHLIRYLKVSNQSLDKYRANTTFEGPVFSKRTIRKLGPFG